MKKKRKEKVKNNTEKLQKNVFLDGESTLSWNAQRSSSVKLATLILVAIIYLGIYSAIKLTSAITEKRRPPTLGALGWLATTLFALIEIGDQTAPIQDNIVGFRWPVTFRFLRDDLVDANVHPEVGDVILFQESYWEVDNTNIVQFWAGKDPDYPYESNPLTPPIYETEELTDAVRFCYNLGRDFTVRTIAQWNKENM